MRGRKSEREREGEGERECVCVCATDAEPPNRRVFPPCWAVGRTFRCVYGRRARMSLWMASPHSASSGLSQCIQANVYFAATTDSLSCSSQYVAQRGAVQRLARRCVLVAVNCCGGAAMLTCVPSQRCQLWARHHRRRYARCFSN